MSPSQSNPEILRALKSYRQWFGSYKKSGELKKIQVWLTVNDGRIEFLTPGDSYKAKRVRRNPRAICFLGSQNGPQVPGMVEIVNDRSALERVYHAYQKSHPVLMMVLGRGIRKNIEQGKQVVIRVFPEEPNPLAGITDPLV